MSEAIKGTMISYRPDIKVLDATIRDGGLVNNFEFTDDFVRKLYLTNLRAGVDIMEIGYLADPELFEESKFGKWKFCHEDAIQKVLGDILDPKMQLAVMADVGRANVARDLPDKKDSILDVVRIATYINTIPAAIEMIEICAKKGYHTTVNIMAVSKAQESELEEALEMLGKSSVENHQLCIFPLCSLLHQTNHIHGVVRGQHHRTAWLDDACFLRSNFCECISQQCHMIEGYRSNRANKRFFYHVGSIQQSTDPRFQNHKIAFLLQKPEQCNGKCDLKL